MSLTLARSLRLRAQVALRRGTARFETLNFGIFLKISPTHAHFFSAKAAAPKDDLPDYAIRGATLTEKEVALIRSSWAAVMEGTPAFHRYIASGGTAKDPTSLATIGAAAVAVDNAESPKLFFFNTFYGRLFTQYPSVKPLFKENTAVQGRALTAMVNMAVRSLTDVNALVPVLQNLAKRHVKYGSTVAQYGPVGLVLLHALERTSGPEHWTPETATAWLKCYSIIVSVMVPAQQEEERRVAAGGV